MAEFAEAVMVICFGISWPVSILASYTARTAKGRSLIFLFFIFFGYVAGIVSKLISGNITYVFWFYVANLILVSVDMGLYFRNKRLDRLAAQENQQQALE